MSRQYFEITVRYDNNFGGTDEKIIYCLQNNSTDYRYFMDENGDTITCEGTDDYCDSLGYALNLKEYYQEINTWVGKTWIGCKIKEISMKELPSKIIVNCLSKT